MASNVKIVDSPDRAETILKEYKNNISQKMLVGRTSKIVNVSTRLTKKHKINSQKLHEIEYTISEVSGLIIASKIKVVFKLPYVPKWLDEEFIKLYEKSNGHYLNPGYKMNHSIKVAKEVSLNNLCHEKKLKNNEKLFALMYFGKDLDKLEYSHNHYVKVSKNHEKLVNSGNCKVEVTNGEIIIDHDEKVTTVDMIKKLYENYVKNIKVICEDSLLSFLTYNIFRPDKVTDGLEELTLLHHIHNGENINILKNPINRLFYNRLYIYLRVLSGKNVKKYTSPSHDKIFYRDFSKLFFYDNFEEIFGVVYKDANNYDFVRSHFETRFLFFGDVAHIKSNKTPLENIYEMILYINNVAIDLAEDEFGTNNLSYDRIKIHHIDKSYRLLGDYIYSYNDVAQKFFKYLSKNREDYRKGNYNGLEMVNFYVISVYPHMALLLYKANLNEDYSNEALERLTNLLMKNAFMDRRSWLRRYNFSLDYIIFLMLKYDVPVESYFQVFNTLNDLYIRGELTDTKLHVFFANYDSELPIEWCFELNSNKRKTDKS